MKSLLIVFSCLVMTASTEASILNPKKIGIGTWESDMRGTSLTNLEAMKFGWYYNWRTDHLYSPSSRASRQVPFIPMIWGKKNLHDSVPRAQKVLLGFNEPDIPSQASMTVREAIRAWPQLMSKNLRLGSPATTTSGALGPSSWLGRFMKEAEGRKYRVDFIAVHFYSDNKDVREFKNYLDQIYATYKRPIWVTEWALIDWFQQRRFTRGEVAAYAREALVMLDQHPHVERHAWFAALPYQGGINTELFDSKERMTEIGLVFQEALKARPALAK